MFCKSRNWKSFLVAGLLKLLHTPRHQGFKTANLPYFKPELYMKKIFKNRKAKAHRSHLIQHQLITINLKHNFI